VRILAVDLGDKRVGLAVSDVSGIVATPKPAFHFKNLSYSVDYLSNISQELEVDHILVGMPLLLSGSHGEQANKVKEFIKELRKKISIKIEILDERFSTVEARRRIFENTSKKSQTRMKNLDSPAAAVMLQSYLDFSNKI
tara:strand:+ start:22755 stop:23174 length:420 start_codon:yes stop_codon:yes gene_type:complete